MTLGEKIRKYRQLRNMKQKDFGMKMGFSSHTADSRVRKYESDSMAPKADKRQEIADILGIDISSLSDINIASDADVMHVLFEFEETLGMDIQRIDGSTHLIFDDNNPAIQKLLSYLLIWYNQKQNLPPKDENGELPTDARISYEIWKGRFPMDLHAYWKQIEAQLSAFYDPYVKDYASKATPVIKASEFVLLLRKMIQTNISISSQVKSFGVGSGSLLLSFQVKELMDQEKPDIISVFTEYLYALEVFKGYGMKISTDLLSVEKGFLITYELELPYMMSLNKTIKQLVQYEATRDTLDDWSKEYFEKNFSSDLAQYDVNLKDEIAIYYNLDEK